MAIQHLSWHNELMDRMLTGQTLEEIAGEMNLTVGYLKVVAESPLFVSKLEEVRSERYRAIGERLEDYSHEALDKLVEKMRNAKADAIQLQAAREILDRSGYVKVDKTLSVVADAEKVIRELGRLRGSNGKRVEDSEGDGSGNELTVGDDKDGADLDSGRDRPVATD